MPNHIPHAPYGADPNYAQPAQPSPWPQYAPPPTHQPSLLERFVLRLDPMFSGMAERKLSQYLHLHQQQQLAREAREQSPHAGEGYFAPTATVPPGHPDGPGGFGFPPGYAPPPGYPPYAAHPHQHPYAHGQGHWNASAPYPSAGAAPHQPYAPGFENQILGRIATELDKFSSKLNDVLGRLDRRSSSRHRTHDPSQLRHDYGRYPQNGPPPPVPNFSGNFHEQPPVGSHEQQRQPRQHIPPLSSTGPERQQEQDKASAIEEWHSGVSEASRVRDVDENVSTSSDDSDRSDRRRHVRRKPLSEPRIAAERGGNLGREAGERRNAENRVAAEALEIAGANHRTEVETSKDGRDFVLRHLVR